VKSLLRISVSSLALLVLVALAPTAASARKSYHLGDRTLTVGKRGHDVRVLQVYLSRIGANTGVDGVFGRGTKASVKQFERSQLRRADGKVTRSDARALRDVVKNGGAIMSSALTGGAMPTMQEIQAAEDAPLQTTPGAKAKLGSDGLAIAPASAPPAIKAVIAAGNKIAKKPYIYGGGHGQSMPSGGFMTWGSAGYGSWITLFANGGHIYAVIAGLRFDTSGKSATGSRWQTDMRSPSGYKIRHPTGY